MLQDWEVLRVGATVPKKVDVRVVAATNKELEREVAKGTFRSDLYYRLKVAVLNIPPLRSRRVDILPLAQSFLTFYGKKYRKAVNLSEEAKQVLQNHTWPGNVRELENLVQGLVVTCKHGLVGVRDLAGIRPLPPCETSEASTPCPLLKAARSKAL